MLSMLSPMPRPVLHAFIDAAMTDTIRRRKRTGCHLDRTPSSMLDNDTHYALTLEVPGVSHQDVVIEVKDSRLTIKGETRTTKLTHFRVNCSVMLPTDADADKATATCVDGILNVQVPKKTDAAPSSITVSSDAETSDDEASAGDARPHYKITLVAAGLAASDVEATIDSCGALMISGETKRTGVKMARCFQLPRDADGENATASHVDGILTVTVPKRQKVEPTYVSVMVTTGEPSAEEDDALSPSSLAASEEQDNVPKSTSSAGEAEGAMEEDEDAVMV